MGPTCILPGGQYFGVDQDKNQEVAESLGRAMGLSEFKVTTPLAQGTCIMIHFHMYHRGSARLENPERTEPWAVSRQGPAPLRPMVTPFPPFPPSLPGFLCPSPSDCLLSV